MPAAGLTAVDIIATVIVALVFPLTLIAIFISLVLALVGLTFIAIYKLSASIGRGLVSWGSNYFVEVIVIVAVVCVLLFIVELYR